MERMLCFPSPLRGLLSIEVYLLAAVAGVLVFRHPGAGLLLFLLVWLLDCPRLCKLGTIALYCTSFLLAYGYASLCDPTPPKVPLWLEQAAYTTFNERGERQRPRPVRIRAEVSNCDRLPGNRARIILRGAAPVLSSRDDSLKQQDLRPYQGAIVWSWRNAEFFPSPGETLELTLRLSAVHGLANPGVWEVDSYWHDKGVWFRAWVGNHPDIQRIGEHGTLLQGVRHSLATARSSLIKGFIAALPQSPQPKNDEAPPIEQAMTQPEKPTPREFPDGARILPALLFADKSLLTEDIVDLFSRATLSHSLALSGLHLGFCALGAAAIAWCIGRLYPSLWNRIPRSNFIIIATVPLAALYLWLGAAPISLLRAACMFSFWAVLVILHRPRVLLDGLFAALALLLAINPFALFDIGLQLSALSVATIALCLPWILRFAKRCFPQKTLPGAVGRGLITLTGTSFCIQLALFPLVARTFGTAGLLFPLNLIWIPVVGFFVLPTAFIGLTASALGLEGVAAAILNCAAFPGTVLTGLLTGLHEYGLLEAPVLPRLHWSSIAGLWTLCLVAPSAIILWRQMNSRGRKAYALLTTLALICVTAMPLKSVFDNTRTGVRLTLIDVGQGQSVLVDWSGIGNSRTHGRVLVDGGGFVGNTFDVGKSVLSPLLTDNALPKLDMVILSHPDTDHLGGLLYLLENFSIERYVSNGDTPAPLLAEKESKAIAKSGLRKETALAGERIALAENLYFEVVWPEAPGGAITREGRYKQESGNDASLVLRLVWDGRPLALLCGDIEGAAIRKILKRRSEHLHAHVLVVPHHGSKRSLVENLYEAVAPAHAVAGTGYENRWGFPSVAVRNSLEQKGIPLHHTGASGQIRFEWRTPDALPEPSLTRPGPTPIRP